MLSTIPSEAFGIILLGSGNTRPTAATPRLPPVGRHCHDVLMAAFVRVSPAQRHEF